MKNKITVRMILLMLVFGFVTMLTVTYNARQEGIKSGLKKADAIAEVVKSGLTAHMINGNMNQVNVFLNSIAQTKNVDRIWIIRGDNVIKQFGEASSLVAPKDKIDDEVIKSGNPYFELSETFFSKAELRVTIPYKAVASQNINCLNCHSVNPNDTLGAVSIVLDVTDFKDNGIQNSLIIILITLLTVLLVAYFINKLINPYIETLEIIKNRIDAASNGVFKNITILKDKNAPRETKELIDKYNLLTDSLMNTFTDIDNKLKGFVGQTVDPDLHSNPLEEANHIINNLSYIYQFKKEIQLDKTKKEIYKRLCDIFKNQFNLSNVNIVEITNNETAEKVYQIGDLDFCTSVILKDPKECRVSRNANNVSSVDFQKACPCFASDDYLYFCIDIEIGLNSKIVFNFILKDKDELNTFKKNQLFIESYIKEVAPEIEVKRLLKALEDSALKDGLTGLYNRRFLDEHLKKLIPQAKREEMNIGLLMLDMDHFKAVNDEYGHDIGDKVLVSFAQTVQENIRDSDIAVRFGGEEFLVLLVGVKSEQDAIDVANKIREKVSLNEIDVYAGSTMRKTISIGLSMFPQDSTSIVKVMKFADLALYEAKTSGRNQVRRYEENPTDTLELF
jgi:two-component system cell cycle response regulator